MKNTPKFRGIKAAGILCIVAGALWIISMIFGVYILWELTDLFIMGGDSPGLPLFFIYLVIGLLMMVFGVMSIIGGVSALHRRKWGLALTGSVCAIVCFFYLGIPATILLVMHKREFEPVKEPSV
jgi:hypothetical protein